MSVAFHLEIDRFVDKFNASGISSLKIRDLEKGIRSFKRSQIALEDYPRYDTIPFRLKCYHCLKISHKALKTH
jgi:hypothetical protein